MEKKTLIIIFIILCTITGIILGMKLSGTNDSATISKYQDYTVVELGILACLKVNTTCNYSDKNISLSIELADEIKYLQYFSVRVIIHSQMPEIKSVGAVFKMINMDMGLNQFIFKPILVNKNKESIWHTNAILPVCVTGRNDWVMELNVLTLDKINYRLNIPFQVTG